ncbi:MAG: DNA repair protein RecO [Firmicutes bacterium]|jgi:DNA repair protein RecO (recombination protein O)|nr:DNA repair protein RecO [Bacillota bacterium]
MALYTTEGIVLKTQNIGEADRICTIYSRGKGKARAVARGARRPRSRFVSSTQMFAYGDFQIFTGKSLDGISQVELKESFPRLHDDLVKLAYASYVAELVSEMTEEGDGDQIVFDMLLAYMRVLSETSDPGLVTVAFEIKFATILGYRPRLESCSECGSETLSREVYFNPEAGGIICNRCSQGSPGKTRVSWGAVRLLEALLMAEFIKIERIKANPGVRREIERLIRAHLGFRLNRRLKSLEFLEAVTKTP